MPVWLEALVAIATVLSAAIALVVAWVAMKIRGDLAEFQLRILDVLDEKLRDYVQVETFKMYSEAHAKEHIALIRELTHPPIA